jgi:hypothetical protein
MVPFTNLFFFFFLHYTDAHKRRENCEEGKELQNYFHPFSPFYFPSPSSACLSTCASVCYVGIKILLWGWGKRFGSRRNLLCPGYKREQLDKEWLPSSSRFDFIYEIFQVIKSSFSFGHEVRPTNDLFGLHDFTRPEVCVVVVQVL